MLGYVLVICEYLNDVMASWDPAWSSNWIQLMADCLTLKNRSLPLSVILPDLSMTIANLPSLGRSLWAKKRVNTLLKKACKYFSR